MDDIRQALNYVSGLLSPDDQKKLLAECNGR